MPAEPAGPTSGSTAPRREQEPSARRVRRDDLLAGGAFLGLGLAFLLGGLQYDLGTALRMGPGYVPVVLGALLVGLGLLVAAEGVFADRLGGADGTGLPDPSGEPGIDVHEGKGPVPWRRAALLVAAIVLFGVLVDPLGLAPSLVLTVFLAALAGEGTGPVRAVVVAVALTVLILVVFVLLLQLRLPLLGEWLGG